MGPFWGPQCVQSAARCYRRGVFSKTRNQLSDPPVKQARNRWTIGYHLENKGTLIPTSSPRSGHFQESETGCLEFLGGFDLPSSISCCLRRCLKS
jgi:hypothetical protein